MSAFFLSQTLVGIAILTDIMSFQFKERKKIVGCLLVSATLIAVHFMLLGHWTAALIGIVSALRFFTSIFTTSKKLMALFVSAAIVITIFSYAGLLSILGCGAGVTGTIASFCKEDKILRQLMLIATTLWISHNILAGSPGAVLMESIFFGSNLVGYFRFYIRPQRQLKRQLKSQPLGP